MYIYIYVYTSLCIYIYTRAHIYIYIYKCTYAYVSIHTYTYLYTCMYAHIYIYIWACSLSISCWGILEVSDASARQDIWDYDIGNYRGDLLPAHSAFQETLECSGCQWRCVVFLQPLPSVKAFNNSWRHRVPVKEHCLQGQISLNLALPGACAASLS